MKGRVSVPHSISEIDYRRADARQGRAFVWVGLLLVAAMGTASLPGCAEENGRKHLGLVPSRDAEVTFYTTGRPTAKSTDAAELVSLHSGSVTAHFYRDGSATVSDGTCTLPLYGNSNFRTNVQEDVNTNAPAGALRFYMFLGKALGALPGVVAEHVRFGDEFAATAREIGSMLLGRPAVRFWSEPLECELRLTDTGRAKLQSALDAAETRPAPAVSGKRDE